MIDSNGATSRRNPQLSHTVEDDFAVFEQLPPSVRHTIREMSQRMSAIGTSTMLDTRGMSFTVWALGEQERREISRFAQDYIKATGQEYPFLAANATVQRYNSRYYTSTRPKRRQRQKWFDADIMKVPDAPRRRRSRGR